MPTTTDEIHATLRAMQDIADRLALGVTFSLKLGSASMGISYKLYTARLGAPEESRPIGRSRTEAQESLRAMTLAFDIVRRSQIEQRATSDVLRTFGPKAFDPDARSVRRDGERG
jgi:hypothetical protein